MSKRKKIGKSGGPMDEKFGWLYGWKDIAEYVGCSVKTTQRYAKENRLPIRRLLEGKPVAQPKEIDVWIKSLKKS